VIGLLASEGGRGLISARSKKQIQRAFGR